jgi:hypothetical protein
MLRAAFSLPEAVLDAERAGSNVEWLPEKVGEDLAGATGNHMELFPTTVFWYRSREGIGDTVRHTVPLAATPTDDDGNSMRLPKALTPFYRLVRSGKLILEHGVGWRPGRRLDFR